MSSRALADMPASLRADASESDLEAALQSFDRALGADQSNVRALINRASVLERLHRPEEAQAARR